MINKKNEKKVPVKDAKKPAPVENQTKKPDEKSSLSRKKADQSGESSGCC